MKMRCKRWLTGTRAGANRPSQSFSSLPADMMEDCTNDDNPKHVCLNDLLLISSLPEDMREDCDDSDDNENIEEYNVVWMGKQLTFGTHRLILKSKVHNQWKLGSKSDRDKIKTNYWKRLTVTKLYKKQMTVMTKVAPVHSVLDRAGHVCSVFHSVS